MEENMKTGLLKIVLSLICLLLFALVGCTVENGANQENVVVKDDEAQATAVSSPTIIATDVPSVVPSSPTPLASTEDASPPPSTSTPIPSPTSVPTPKHVPYPTPRAYFIQAFGQAQCGDHPLSEETVTLLRLSAPNSYSIIQETITDSQGRWFVNFRGNSGEFYLYFGTPDDEKLAPLDSQIHALTGEESFADFGIEIRSGDESLRCQD